MTHDDFQPSEKDIAALKAKISATSIDYIGPLQHADLHAAVDDLYRKAAELPGVKTVPPVPQLFLYDGPVMNFGSYTMGNQGEQHDGIGISRLALQNATPEEIKGQLAHETAHRLLSKNPDMFQLYLPPNAKELIDDANKQGVNPSVTTNRMIEMVADQIALHLTCDSGNLKSFFEKAYNYVDPKKENDFIREAKAGDPVFAKLLPDEQRKIFRESLAEVHNSTPQDKTDNHPSLSIRLHGLPATTVGCPVDARQR